MRFGNNCRHSFFSVYGGLLDYFWLTQKEPLLAAVEHRREGGGIGLASSKQNDDLWGLSNRRQVNQDQRLFIAGKDRLLVGKVVPILL